jgi:hypothetical protein
MIGGFLTTILETEDVLTPSSFIQRNNHANGTEMRYTSPEAGLQDGRIYDTRGTFASRANACHASGLTITQLLGHSNTAILPAVRETA